jgi:hypothetical protein
MPNNREESAVRIAGLILINALVFEEDLRVTRRKSRHSAKSGRGRIVVRT